MGAVTSSPGALAGAAQSGGISLVPTAASGIGSGANYLKGKLGQRGPLSGLIGQGGGVAGTGFAAPQTPGLMQPVTAEQLSAGQAGVGNSLEAQQRLLAALQGQNAVGQQSNVLGQQQALANQLSQANGLAAQQGALKGLQGAAGMYGDIAAGRGPNPAQAALNQATGQNVANQAAMMAGQRGAGANVGLMARQAAQQGAATQQQAVGQGAQMQAQQQLAGIQGLMGANQAIAGIGGNQLAAQQAQQQALAGQSNLMAGQQLNATQQAAQAQLANQQQLQQAAQGYNQANIAGQGNVNTANAALAQTQMQGQQGLLGGLLGGAGSAMGLAKAEGGEVTKMADGGDPSLPLIAPVSSEQFFQAGPAQGPTSAFGNFLSGWTSQPQVPDEDVVTKQEKKDKEEKSAISSMGNSALNKGTSQFVQGGSKLAMAAAAKGGLAKSGGHVAAKSGGQKAVKGGDSYDNDKIPTMLSEGEIVLPRSVTMSQDPIKASADFVAKVLAKRRAKGA